MTGIFFKILCGAVALCVFGCLAADQHWIGSGDRVVTWTNSLPADRMRLGVKDEGVYRVSAAELAVASGFAADDLRAALSAGGLALSNGVHAVAWTTDGEALYFLGEPTTELFAPENVYWVTFGQGLTMQTFDAAPDPAAATNLWFISTQSFRSAFVAPYDSRDRRSSAATLTNVLNFGEWVQSTSTESSRASIRTVALPGFCDTAQTGVVARVSVVSYCDFDASDNHICEVWLNGTNCGSSSWTNEQAVVFDCSASTGVVTNGPVQIKIRNGLATGTVSDFMLLDATLIYPRNYCAVSNALLCAGGAGQTVAVGGFGSSDVWVWDVTASTAPAVLDAPLWQDTNGTWSAAFACGDASARYAVFGKSAGCFQPSVSGVRDTDWTAPGEMPELAIVIPPRRWVSGFDATVQPLVEFRRKQGLRTRVIDAEELYNAFTDGLVHPAAFQRFCAAGVTCTPQLRYLLFAGHAGADYKLDAFGFGERIPYPAFFPLYLLPQRDDSELMAFLLPNDPVLGDADGDGVPDVAVGRFIARNTSELANMVNKTIRYELVESWRNKAVFSSCWESAARSDLDFDMIASNTAAGFVSAGWTVSSFYGGDAAGGADMTSLWDYGDYGPSVKSEFTAGAGFFFYFGHSNENVAGPTASDTTCLISNTRLQNGTWSFAPVAAMMGCRSGRWTSLMLKSLTPCIAEAGVRNPASGFTAVISASGFIGDADAAAFSYAIRNRIAAGDLRLGDVWRGAFGQIGEAMSKRMQHLTFLGDPSLCIRAGETARGTPWPWLIGQGLTGDPYADLEDPDSDGFATWQEYQAGTDYLGKGLKIRAFVSGGVSAGTASLVFEPDAGTYNHFRVLATTNLASGVWETVPWKANAGDAWSVSSIPVDWPVESILVPCADGEVSRFYKMESSDE
jgi:hypothetical protein